ncbi:MAG TPA: chromate transporter [Pseudoduganella sp.]
MKINCWALFKLFSQMALLGFGGVLPFAYRYLVERSRWLSDSEFAQLLSIAQLLPGPTICNLAVIVGQRFAGTGGALAALAGLLVAPFFIVIALGVGYQELATSALFAHALQGMAAAAAGLILATAGKLARGMWRDDAPRPAGPARARPVTSPSAPSLTLTAAGKDAFAAVGAARCDASAGAMFAEDVDGAAGSRRASVSSTRGTPFAGTVVAAGADAVAAAGLVGAGLSSAAPSTFANWAPGADDVDGAGLGAVTSATEGASVGLAAQRRVGGAGEGEGEGEQGGRGGGQTALVAAGATGGDAAVAMGTVRDRGAEREEIGTQEAMEAAVAVEAREATGAAEARVARRVTQVALLAMAFVGLGVLKLGLVTVVCALAPFGFVMFAFVWRLP